MHRKKTKEITALIIAAADKARRQSGWTADAKVGKAVNWPVECTVGPGLEGAIACESKVGYVDGSKGALSYRGYDIFDLCAHSCFEEVSYLLLRGSLPTKPQLAAYRRRLNDCLNIPSTLRHLAGFRIEDMDSMAALRLGTNMMRYEIAELHVEPVSAEKVALIGSDEDSIPMETTPMGSEHAIYEFKKGSSSARNMATGCQLVSGVASLTAAIARLREGKLPIEPDSELSHAGNLLYMMTGHRPSPVEERIMDVSLILHADHGINASTFAAMVVASTLSDVYSSIGAAVGALTGPLHGGANEAVIHMLNGIGSVDNVESWYAKTQRKKERVMGMGHRVYKVYDPRARILGPLAKYLARDNPETKNQYRIATRLEKEVVASLGKKGIFPNVDFYSGMVYNALDIPHELFTPIFAVSRVSGWTARVFEYLRNNRIFRPRVMYNGPVAREYVSIGRRKPRKRG